ncbi:MAG: hypothetical protein ACUVRG_10115 [Ignavibacterium sp.]
MSNAGNTNSAKENIGMIKKLLEQASNKVKASQVAGIAELFAPIEKTTNDWLKAIENSDSKTANSLYASFLADFPKLFIASM